MCRTVPSVLRLRQVTEVDEAVAHHAGNLFLAGVVDLALKFEARRAADGRLMPLGFQSDRSRIASEGATG
jgi:hypothetical protein